MSVKSCVSRVPAEYVSDVYVYVNVYMCVVMEIKVGRLKNIGICLFARQPCVDSGRDGGGGEVSDSRFLGVFLSLYF